MEVIVDKLLFNEKNKVDFIIKFKKESVFKKYEFIYDDNVSKKMLIDYYLYK